MGRDHCNAKYKKSRGFSHSCERKCEQRCYSSQNKVAQASNKFLEKPFNPPLMRFSHLKLAAVLQSHLSAHVLCHFMLGISFLVYQLQKYYTAIKEVCSTELGPRSCLHLFFAFWVLFHVFVHVGKLFNLRAWIVLP